MLPIRLLWYQLSSGAVDASWREVSRCFMIVALLLAGGSAVIPDPVLSRVTAWLATGCLGVATYIEKFIKEDEMRESEPQPSNTPTTSDRGDT
jgi:hypothetical protein